MVVTAVGVLGAACPALTIGLGAPQALRLLRSHNADGVSLATWVLGVVLAELWGAYGFIAHVPAEVAANLPSGALSVIVVVLVGYRARAMATVVAISSALLGATTLLVVGSVVYNVKGLVSVVAVAGAIGLYLPQLMKVFRDPNVAAVSLASWAIAFLSASSWTAYSIVVHKLPVFLPNVVMLPSAVAIMARVALLRAREGRRGSRAGQ